MRFLLLVLSSIYLSSPSYPQDYELIWADEFDGNSLNETYWNYELGNGNGGWGTGQMDYCTKENVVVSDGTLKLVLKKEDPAKGFFYSSGRINTQNKKYFKYGKIEARCKIPAGHGIGAAFWMLPQFEKYGWWPRSGEIDILETNGHTPFTNYGTVHFMQWDIHQFKGNHAYCDSNLAETWHTYTILWNENSIKWLLDGQQYHEFNLSEDIDGRKPFNEEFYIIISAGIGSNFSGKKIDDKLLPQNFEIDYVRCYKELTNPKIISAITDDLGTQVRVKFSEPIDLAENNSVNDFKIISQNTEYSITKISRAYRDDQTVLLELNSSIEKNDRLTLSYSGQSIISKFNQPASPTSKIMVYNLIDGSPPQLIEVRTESDPFIIDLEFSKPLRASSIDTDRISISKNGQITRFEIDSITKSGLKLKTEQAILQSDTVKINFQQGAISSTDSGAVAATGQIQVLNRQKKLASAPSRIEAEDYYYQSGIRTEDCNDTGNGKNIGYIDPKDWMSYYIHVEEESTYLLKLRTSCNKTGTMLQVWVDGKFHKMLFPPFTGDWQKWTDLIAGELELDRGVHELKIKCSGGGFNLNWLEMERPK